MRIVIAPDSFKGSLSAAQAAAAMAAGVASALPHATTVELPLADGGEGFVDAVATAVGAHRVTVDVADPLGGTVAAVFGILDDLAIIEVAQAIGLPLRPERDVLHASSRGVGQLIREALDRGAKRIIVGLGGSATNDGGAGMLAELGVRFLDAARQPLSPDPISLVEVAEVDASGLDPRIPAVTIEAACDVTNPLTGPQGASAVFGPQKGAAERDVVVLDEVLARLATVSGELTAAQAPGAGAAGGLGWALTAFLGARLRSGFDLVAQAVGLEEAIAGSDLVLTGEGRVDAQTIDGKTPAGVARLAARHGVPTIVLAGLVGQGAAALREIGVARIVGIVPEGMSLEVALATAATNLRQATAAVMRTWG